tara:strand:- start:1165 stop:2190 length:1026 start_codon:yes stop_codon:yes gene_type:complete
MASTYTNLGIEKMVTGEQAGLWGDKTNTNLEILEQIAGGYISKQITAGTNTLTVTNGGTGSEVATSVIEFTSSGSLGSSASVVIPDGTEMNYILKNSTTGGQAITFKTSSGSGVTWSTTTTKIVYSNGTNVIEVQTGGDVVDDTSPQLGGNLDVNGNSIVSVSNGNIPLAPNGTGVVQISGNSTQAGILRFTEDTDDGSNYVQLKAPTLAGDITLTLPATDGNADEFLKTNGSGVLSFAAVSGGTSWQAVKTADFTAVAGEGYFINTTSQAITMTLPSSPSIGDEVVFIDYAGTFDTLNMTVGRNSQKIQGTAANLTVSTERAGNTLVYTDATQGWLLKNN